MEAAIAAVSPKAAHFLAFFIIFYLPFAFMETHPVMYPVTFPVCEINIAHSTPVRKRNLGRIFHFVNFYIFSFIFLYSFHSILVYPFLRHTSAFCLMRRKKPRMTRPSAGLSAQLLLFLFLFMQFQRKPIRILEKRKFPSGKFIGPYRLRNNSLTI